MDIWQSPNSPTPSDVVAQDKCFQLAPRELNKLVNFFAGAVARGKKLANDRLIILKWCALVIRSKSDLVILGAKLGGVVVVFAIAEVVARVRV